MHRRSAKEAKQCAKVWAESDEVARNCCIGKSLGIVSPDSGKFLERIVSCR